MRTLMKAPFIALLLILAACGSNPPKPTISSADNQSRDTVYDESSENENRRGGITDEEYVGEEDLDIPLEEDLDTSDLEVLENETAAGLDWEPVYFGFDESILTPGAREKLADYARVLRNRPDLTVLLEGHCDSRGTEEYNMALGERRAQTVRTYLQQLGVADTVLRTISYGELRPLDPREEEAAWARNRRVSFTFPVGARN
ncbi:MAG: OmpA family protein [Acidobacteriota bacterium]|nr:OmpA family protein [Acidobacteriota bacterium]